MKKIFLIVFVAMAFGCGDDDVQCLAAPTCGPDRVEVESCDGLEDCDEVTVCGQTIYCVPDS